METKTKKKDDIQLVRHPDNNEVVPKTWKEIDEYDGWYEVSNYGRVRSWKKSNYTRKNTGEPCYLNPSDNNRGYLQVVLYKNRKRKSYKVHRLVAESFLDNPKDKFQVNHKDGDKYNNYVWNLEWSTATENVQHSHKNGLSPSCKGIKNSQSKLDKEQVLRIRNLYPEKTQKDIARDFNISHSTVNAIINKRLWSHV